MTHPLAPLPAPVGVTPQQVVDGIARVSGSSFGLGMRLLRKPRRRAMRAVYAFCRIVDDIADGDLPATERLALLQQWRDEIGQLYFGVPRSAVGQALRGPVEAFGLPREEFLMVIEGMEMDAVGPMVAPTVEELRAYTRRAAGAVGVLSMHVFNAWRGEVSERFALALGDALQLTNILRDVEVDARIGRIYLPAEYLDTAGVPRDPAEVPGHPALATARAMLAEDARSSFAEARLLIGKHRRRALVPALAMYGVYRAYFQQMEAAGWDPSPALSMRRSSKLRHGLSGILFP